MVYLENGKKYSLEERKMYSKCKIDYVFFIFNIMKNDEGRYICYWECDEDIKIVVIDLKVFVDFFIIGNNLLIFVKLNWKF